MKKKLIIVVLILLGIAAYFYVRRSSAVDPASVQEARYSGNVEIRRVNLSFRVSGRLSTVEFDEGAATRRGEVFATLDAEPFEVEVVAAEAALKEAEAARAEAEATRERLENGARPQEIEEARALVAEYEANLSRAESEFARDQKLRETRAVSESQLEASEESAQVVKARLARAKEALSLLEEGTRKEDLAASAAAVERANAAVKKAEATLRKARIALSDAALVAPNDGVVLTRVAEPGANITAGQTVATLSIRDEIWVYIYLEGVDNGRIAVGAPVEITTESGEKTYRGTIGYVSPEAEFTPKTVETKSLKPNLVYRARVRVEDPDDSLRQGMPVDVVIPYATAKNPSEGVFNSPVTDVATENATSDAGQDARER